MTRARQGAVRVPERADGGHRFFEPRNGFAPLNAVWFIAFPLPNTNAEDRATPGEQVQRRGGLCGDRRIAATGVGDAHTQPQPPDAVAGGQTSEHGPRLQLSIDLRYQLRAAEISRRCDCLRDQRIEVISHPEGVNTGGDGSKVNGSDHRGRGPPSIEGLSTDADAKSSHAQGLSF